MKSKIIFINTDFASWCNLCLSPAFPPPKIKKAHLIYDLNKSEKIEAQKRVLFFNKTILVCFSCMSAKSSLGNLWQKVLALPELEKFNPAEEYEITSFSYPELNI